MSKMLAAQRRPQIAASMVRRVFGLFVLLAFAWQSLIIQSHVHGAHEAEALTASAMAAQSATAAASSTSHRTKAHCWICREFAHAGRFILPTPPTFTDPIAALEWVAPLLPLAWSYATRSHAWLSRGPPPASN